MSTPAAPTGQVERFTRRDITAIAVHTRTPITDVADAVYRLITVLGYDAVVASADSVLGNHELTETAAARVRDTVLDRSCQRVTLPDGEVSVFEPAPDTDDASRMYGLDVLELSIMARCKREEDGTVTSVVEISEDPGGVLEVIARHRERLRGAGGG